jgi:hypothetical protein
VPYVDPNLVHNPTTGAVAPAAWGDVVRDDLEFLIDPPVCSVFNSTVQSVANNTVAAMLANSENFDNDAMHSTVSNTSRLTIQTAGRYLFIATMLFAIDVDGFRSVKFQVNGTGTIYESSRFPAVISNTMVATGVRSLSLAAGDYVEAFAHHTAGAALDVTLLEYFASFETR